VSGAKKAVFFDLGGTLLIMRRDKIFHKVLAEEQREVSLESVHSAYIKVESRRLSVFGNRAISPEETNEAYRQKDVRVFKELFPDETSEEAERMSWVVRARWPQLEKTIPFEMYPDSEPLLKRLAGDGFALGLVSNAPPDTAKVVADLGLHRYIGTIVISGIVGFSKPHPEIFRMALRQAGVEPHETIHVGDVYDSDVVGARNAGIQGVLIDREGRQSGLDCPRISNLHEVYGLID
jgi:HAD superfamily hydrolase (TIGR01549 family)